MKNKSLSLIANIPKKIKYKNLIYNLDINDRYLINYVNVNNDNDNDNKNINIITILAYNINTRNSIELDTIEYQQKIDILFRYDKEYKILRDYSFHQLFEELK